MYSTKALFTSSMAFKAIIAGDSQGKEENLITIGFPKDPGRY